MLPNLFGGQKKKKKKTMNNRLNKPPNKVQASLIDRDKILYFCFFETII